MRLIRKILISTGIMAVMLVIASGVLAWIFEDELSRYVVEGLNQKIRTEARIGNIRLRFLRKFPDASLELKEVIMQGVPAGEAPSDTLLKAERIYLQFNVLQVLQRRYELKEVSIQSGRIQLSVDQDGMDNYTFWIPRESEPEDPFLLSLKSVNLEDIDLRYSNHVLGLDIQTSIRQCHFSGRFARQEFAMNAGIRGRLYHYMKEGKAYFRNHDFRLNAALLIDPMAIQIDQGILSISGQKLMVDGRLDRPGPYHLHLNVKGSSLDLARFTRYTSPFTDIFEEDLSIGGQMDFDASIEGIAGKTMLPEIRASFRISGGWMEVPRMHAPVRELETHGEYRNGRERSLSSTQISMKNTSFTVGNSRIGGDLYLRDLQELHFHHDLLFEIDLQDVEPYIKRDSLLSNLKGMVRGELSLAGDQLSLKNFEPEELLSFRYDGSVFLEHVGFILPERNLEFGGFTGELRYKDHLLLRNLSGKIKKSQVNVSGRVDNLMDFLLMPGANLWTDLDIYSENLDLSYLFGKNKNKLGKSRRDTFQLPDRLYTKARFWIDQLEMDAFHAKQLTGAFTYRPGRMDIHSLNLRSMDGVADASGLLALQPDQQYLVRISAQLDDINIRKAFSSFHNFGQDFIQERHLRGTLDGRVNFSSEFDPFMKIRKESILADCDVSIRNGELSGFEPMMKLSRFIEVQELENVQFSELNNQIYIRQQEVVIPQMDIISSAFDITASGIHGFNKAFEYRLKVSLSDILARKKRGQTTSEFGIIEDDGLGRMFIFLIIEGMGRETKVRYDRRGALLNVREEIREEKQEIREILNQEFGLFRKDTSLGKTPEEEDTPGFILEWEETADTIDSEDLRPPADSARRKFRIIWDEEEEID